MKRGNITVFLALSLMLVLSFLFSMVEAGRVQGMKMMVQRKLLLTLESAFGEYNSSLWQDYGLLFLDGSYGTGELDMALLEGHMMEEEYQREKNISLYQMALKNVEIEGYALATDDAGAAFEAQACRAIQEQLAVGAVDGLKETLTKGREMSEENGSLKERWKTIMDASEEAEAYEETGEASDEELSEKALGIDDIELPDIDEGEIEPDEETPENPMGYVDLLKESALLAMVAENPSEISAKSIITQDNVKDRNKNCGNMETAEGGVIDKLWFLQYINHYFSCGTGAGEGGAEAHALDYELEYCIGGKASDSENLEEAVKAILLIREVGNFMTLLQDKQKCLLALEIATLAVGFTGLAPLIKALQIGILLAWSYVESILDVRCLLAGGKVALVKAASEWKSDVSLIRTSIEQKADRKEDENGLDYRGYLQIILFMVPEETLVYRAMDIVEKNIKLLPGCGEFRMDALIERVRVRVLYTSAPLFLSFVTLINAKSGEYRFVGEKEFCYLEQ